MMNRRNIAGELGLDPLPAFQVQPGAGLNTFSDVGNFPMPASPDVYASRQASFMPPMAQPIGYSPQQALMGGPSPLPRSDAPQQDLGMEILKTYVSNKQDQMSRNSFVQDILAKRFEPTQDDIVRTNLQNTQAALLPESYKTTTAYDTASSRLGLELAPYTTMAKLNGADAPASVQEYQYYNNLTPQDRLEYLKVKRNPTFVNLGDRSMSTSTGEVVYKGVPPQDAPALKGQQAEASAIGEGTGKAKSAIATRAIKAPQIDMLITQAEGLLPKATSGGLAKTARDAAGYFGQATEGSEIDSQLDIIGAALTSGVPRMEGPQSNFDVQLYQQAAGDLANPSKPIKVRQAAARTLRTLNNKYKNLNSEDAVDAPAGGNEINFEDLPN